MTEPFAHDGEFRDARGAAPDEAAENGVQLPVESGRHQARHLPADHLTRGVAKQSLSATVPAMDEAARGAAQNGVVGGFDDGGEEARGVFGRVAARYILLDGDEAGKAAILAPYGRDRHLLDVGSAVLAAIDDLAAPDAAGDDGGPHPFVEFASVGAGLEQARIAPEGLLRAVPGDGGKSGIDIPDTARNVGDHDGLRGLLDGPDELEFLQPVRDAGGEGGYRTGRLPRQAAAPGTQIPHRQEPRAVEAASLGLVHLRGRRGRAVSSRRPFRSP